MIIFPVPAMESNQIKFVSYSPSLPRWKLWPWCTTSGLWTHSHSPECLKGRGEDRACLQPTAQSWHLSSPKLITMAWDHTMIADPGFVQTYLFCWLMNNPSTVKRRFWANQAPKAYRIPVSFIHMAFLASAFLWLQTFTLLRVSHVVVFILAFSSFFSPFKRN